jgi:hypothetical protein
MEARSAQRQPGRGLINVVRCLEDGAQQFNLKGYEHDTQTVDLPSW